MRYVTNSCACGVIYCLVVVCLSTQTPGASVAATIEHDRGLHITLLDSPEKGFFSKVLDFHGIPIKAHKVVADDALIAAYGRLSLLLTNLIIRQPMVISNLIAARAELHIIGRDQ